MPIEPVDAQAKIPLPQIVKENPLKSIAAFVGSAGVILGAVFAIDSRYAHAGDLEIQSLTQQRQITDLQYSNLDDKVFELEIRKSSAPKTWSQTDELMLQRYRSRRAEVFEVKRTQSRLSQTLQEKK